MRWEIKVRTKTDEPVRGWCLFGDINPRINPGDILTGSQASPDRSQASPDGQMRVFVFRIYQKKQKIIEKSVK